MDDLDFFKTDVKEYDALNAEIKEINDKIKPLNTKLRELKSKKSELQGNICEYMAKNDIDTCALKTGKLVYKEAKTTKPLTQNDIKESINSYFGNLPDDFSKMSVSERANSLITYIYDENREKSVKSVLRQTKN